MLHIKYVFQDFKGLDREKVEDDYTKSMQFIWETYYQMKNRNFEDNVTYFILLLKKSY